MAFEVETQVFNGPTLPATQRAHYQLNVDHGHLVSKCQVFDLTQAEAAEHAPATPELAQACT